MLKKSNKPLSISVTFEANFYPSIIVIKFVSRKANRIKVKSTMILFNKDNECSCTIIQRLCDLEKHKNNSVPPRLGCKSFTTIMLPKNCYNTTNIIH